VRKAGERIEAGNRISESTDDKMLHVLRIHCKKLRYLLEFFASLFHPEMRNNLIEQLKRLQDNLGDFNDLRVQEEYLLTVARQLPANRGQSENIFLAIGSLVGALAGDKIVKSFAKPLALCSACKQELFQAFSLRKLLSRPMTTLASATKEVGGAAAVNLSTWQHELA
jgi:inorganic triphosphatase YgiF